MPTHTFPRNPTRAVPGPFLMHVPVVTSRHFCPEDIDLIFDRASALFSMDDGSAVIIKLEDWGDEEMLTPDGRAVIKHFNDLGYCYLRIDGEVGDEVTGLPLFE